MSIYEKYHSEINRNHIYNIVDDILNKEYGIVLSDIKMSKNDFQNQLIQTFSTQNLDDLVSLNKVLINNFISYAKENYKKTDVTNKLSDLLHNREQLFKPKQPVEEKSEHLPLLSSIKTPNTPQTITINSMKRSNVLSSRFHYMYDFIKQNQKSQELKNIDRMIIPIEDHFIFSQPILIVTIKELDYKVYLEKKDVIQHKDRVFGVFEPFDKTMIQRKSVEKITIDIRDISGTKYTFYDIINVNFLEVKEGVITFRCSHIYDSDFKVGDTIKPINMNTNKHQNLFSHPLKIVNIKENKLYCQSNNEIEDLTDDSIDMKLMNTSNQNIMYLNLW
jgi:hypothetical protein